MKKVQRIADRLHVARRYVRAVEMERDLPDHAALDGYVLTPSVRETASRLVAGLSPGSTQRAFRVVGPYGSGKSAFGVFLAQLLRDGDDGLAARLWRAAVPDASALPEWEPIVLSGRRVSLAKELLAKLAERGVARADEMTRAGGALDARAVANVLARHAADTRAKTGRGILLMIDEMGRFLEHAASAISNEDPAIFQEIAERAGGPGDALGVVAFMHHRFADYVSGLGTWIEAEWTRSAERYEELPFGESTEQSLFLLSNALSPPKPHDEAVRRAARQMYGQAIDRGLLVAPRPDVETAADTLYPIHPAAAVALALATRKLGQNERSLFGFLQSLEPAGLQRYAHETAYGPDEWYRPARAFDHVAALAGDRPGGERGRRFTLAADALIAASDMSQGHRDALKTIALIAVLEPLPGLSANIASLAWCLGIGEDATQRLVDDLVSRNVVFRRPHREDFSLWSRSSVDLGAWIAEAHRNVPAPRRLDDTMADLPRPRPAVAHRHYHSTGTLRTFGVGTINAPPASEATDGVILISPVHAGEVKEHALAAAVAATSEDPLALVCLRDVPESDLRWAHELGIWSWISANCAELRVDDLARAEVAERLAVARQALLDALTPLSTLDNGGRTDTWVRGGSVVEVAAGGLSSLLSTMCDDAFPRSPILRNELINRSKLSTAVASARMRLLGRMLSHAEEPYLGLEGAPPERTIYLSMFHVSGLHREIAGKYGFDRPDGDDDHRWAPSWDRLEELLEVDRPVTIADLADELAARPYGIRQGPALLLIAAFAIARRASISLMERNTFQPELTAAHFMRMAKTPSNFALRHVQREGADQGILDSLARGLPTLPGGPCPPTTAAVAERIYRWWGALPQHALDTREIPAEAQAVRSALRKAADPAALLFSTLPEACGSSGDDADAYAEKLDRAIGAIGDAVPLLRRRAAAATLDAFGAGTVAALRANIRTDFEPHLLQLTAHKLRAFLDRALRLGIDDDTWVDGLTSVVTGRRVDTWADNTIDEYSFEIRAIAGRLSRWLALVKAASASSVDLIAVHVIKVDGEETTMVIRRDRPHSGHAGRLERIRAALGDGPGAAQVLSQLLAETIAADDNIKDETR